MARDGLWVSGSGGFDESSHEVDQLGGFFRDLAGHGIGDPSWPWA